jgi:Outer membrane protein beta-barrel domain
MEHLENDMDHLFQKAGELYPLKTSGADWDAVAGNLSEEGFGNPVAAPGMNAGVSRNKRRWLLLFLLIPIGLGSIVYFSSSKKQSAVNSSANIKNSEIKKSIVSSIKTGSQSEKTKTETAQNSEGNKNSLRDKLINSLIQKPTANALNIGRNSKMTGEPVNRNNRRSKNAGVSIDTGESLFTSSSISGKSENDQNSLAQLLAIKPLILSVSETNENITVEGKRFQSVTSGAVNILPLTTKKNANKIPANKGFYVGFIGGPDFSTVKFQSVEQLGYSLGALAGYRFNKHFAVETGLLWDKKFYYTEGKYFSKDQLYIPPSASILNVNGNCYMFEIPVSLRYDFAHSSRNGFFITGGMSSYLMKQQNYTALVSNSSSQWPASFSSDNASNYFFSIVQLSGGYEFAINGNNKIRIEPYVKIPLQGIGIGSLPISSTGIYLGITHSFR